jgi:hypothetical protein
MARIEGYSGNLWSRFNGWYERWTKRTFPDWLYKELTFHPERASRPVNPKRAILICDMIIVAAIIVLAISFLT